MTDDCPKFEILHEKEVMYDRRPDFWAFIVYKILGVFGLQNLENNVIKESA